MLCERTACKHNITLKSHVRIWNEPSTDKPRVYCFSCGRRIKEANQTLKVEYVDPLLTVELANKVYDILVEFGASEFHRTEFVQYVTKEELREFRFIGVFGFGGKIRNRDGILKADYYKEDETPEREQQLAAINTKLHQLSISG